VYDGLEDPLGKERERLHKEELKKENDGKGGPKSGALRGEGRVHL